MTNAQIEKLEARGFKRWTKGNMDRMYVNACNLGLVCEYYNTGNIKYAELDGERISNCQARKMKEAKTFIDVKTGNVYSDNNELKNIATSIFEEITEA